VSFLVAAAVLKTPKRNGYNAQGVNLKFQSAHGGQNGRNVNDAEGRAAALHAQFARHDRGPCRIRCGRRWLLRRNCHTPLLLLGTMLLLG